ncbi:DUF2336 domain-containing protein [Nitratireductor basaltis]|uniref:DUF2336 domain-containing protein n=1 Tax=Nitratireductor basaltis TaxID=472175 RepID=UPI000690FDD7|nr:DUF2336 domain-containing protein [Nitratireductor basaltis]
MDFRQISYGSGRNNAERIFRAAISAFCCLPRPSRKEVQQLDDLTLGLYEAVSVSGLRFASSALSDCSPAPGGLVRRLCNESVDIAAPLLLRSPLLGDPDLIALIGRHGAGHARAIARRDSLNPVIAQLIGKIAQKADAAQKRDTPAPAPRPTPIEEMRLRLRNLMQEEARRAANDHPLPNNGDLARTL